ncbi:hypothetical protein [Kitasatospora sp. P5_F3]
MSTEPEPLGEETADHGDHEAPRQPIDEGGSGPGATRSDGAVAIGESAQRGHVYAVQGGNLSIADITGLLTGLGAATTAVSVVAKAKIDAPVGS